jgi:hypothetical protein
MKKTNFKFLFIVFLMLLNGCTNTQNALVGATVTLDPGSGSVADGALNVSLTPSIVLRFSSPMNALTVNKSTIRLLTATVSSNNFVAVSNITSNISNNIFHFHPLVLLAPNTKYYVVVTSDVRSTTGLPVIGQRLFSFTTGTTAVLTVSIINPSNNATGISLNPGILTFLTNSAANDILSCNVNGLAFDQCAPTGSI